MSFFSLAADFEQFRLVIMANGSAMETLMPEFEQIISQLERGTIVHKFFPRKRPERKTLFIRRETRQIIWARNVGRAGEGYVDMREIKEIRPGKSSKDFDRWPDESKKYDFAKCFVIYYGMEFRLKVLSIAGK